LTDAERNLWRALKAALPQHHWRKQVPLGPYFADFASHSARLIIEVDGGQHDSEIDAARTHFLTAEGYRVIRFWNSDVLQNIDGVVARIAASLSERAR
jgi:very-short-patch-repair endonuclease